MARALDITWHDQSRTFQELYKHETDSRLRARFQALWLLRRGDSLLEVAQIVGVAYRTLLRWVAWYRAGGLADVQAHRHGGHGGRLARLTPEQEQELKGKTEAGEVRSIWDGVHWAEAQGVSYTYWGMRWVFRRLALHKKVPRPRSPQASAAAQAAWKKGVSAEP
jgi:transposase